MSSLRRMLLKRGGELAACSLGLACGWGFSLLFRAGSLPEPPALPEPTPAVQRAQQEAQEPTEHEQFIQELAGEFRLEPEIVRIVHQHSLQYVDPSLPEWRLLRSPEALSYIMISMIHAESRGNPTAVGDEGRARGLTQIWLSTARRYGDVSAESLLDPYTNIRYSFQHFHYLLRKYNGNFPLALYGWNRGAAKVDRLIRYGESPANDYGPKVYSAAQVRERELRLMGN